MADADHSIGAAMPAAAPADVADAEQLALSDAVLAGIRGYAALHLTQGLSLMPAQCGASMPPSLAVSSPLTPKQWQILREMALGFATKQIAHRLCLSPKTVSAHRVQIMERLDIHDVAGLVIFALRQGLVGLDDYRDPHREHRPVRSRPIIA